MCEEIYFCDKQGQGSDEHDHERDLPARDEHERKRSRNRQHAGKELREAHQQAVRKLFGVRDDAAYGVPVRMGIDIGKGEPGELSERVLAQALHHFKGDAVVADAHQPLRDGSDRHGDADFDENAPKGGKIHLSRIDDAVDARRPREWARTA